MTTTLEKLETLEREVAADLETLLTDEVNGVERDPHEAKAIMAAAGVSPKDFGRLVDSRRQRMADAELVANAKRTIADAIEQEQQRDKLIAERDAKIREIREKCAQKLADLETALNSAKTLEGKRRQAIKRLIATCPPALVQEEKDLARTINENQVATERAKDALNDRLFTVRKLAERLEKTPSAQRKQAERELEAAETRLTQAEGALFSLEEDRRELVRQMDELQARKLLA